MDILDKNTATSYNFYKNIIT